MDKMSLSEAFKKEVAQNARLIMLNQLISDTDKIPDLNAFKNHLEDLRKRESSDSNKG